MRLRVPAALATTLALAVMLGGCFLLPEGQAEPSPTASAEAEPGDPEVGDCWTTMDYNWAMWDTWRGDPAIDCEEDHQSYTYAVLDSLGDLDEIYGPSGWVLDDAFQLAFDGCYEALDEFMGTPIGDASRLGAKYFLPTKAEWKHGARWLRCDVLVTKIGSSVFEQVYADLPDDASDLVDAIDDAADYFDVCVDTAEGFTGYGPYFSESAVYSSCSRDPMWRLDGFETIPDDYNTEYPGDDAMAQFAADGCLADMDPSQWGYAHFPDADTWFSGDRSVTCWSYEWEVPEGADQTV